MSQSFPGLTTSYVTRRLSCELPLVHFRSEGYVERQADKSTFWIWHPSASLPWGAQGRVLDAPNP